MSKENSDSEVGMVACVGVPVWDAMSLLSARCGPCGGPCLAQRVPLTVGGPHWAEVVSR